MKTLQDNCLLFKEHITQEQNEAAICLFLVKKVVELVLMYMKSKFHSHYVPGTKSEKTHLT